MCLATLDVVEGFVSAASSHAFMGLTITDLIFIDDYVLHCMFWPIAVFLVKFYTTRSSFYRRRVYILFVDLVMSKILKSFFLKAKVAFIIG